MIPVIDLFRDGNAYAILARCRHAVKRTWPKEKWEAFDKDARSGDYAHLLEVVQQYFEEVRT